MGVVTGWGGEWVPVAENGLHEMKIIDGFGVSDNCQVLTRS